MDIHNILDQFADDVTEIDISNKNIKGSLDFARFSKLTVLYCNDNKITSLDNLPDSLIKLYCNLNKISSLDNLPNSLIELDCTNNQIRSFNNLVSLKLLKYLNCNYNEITNLDNLPNSLIELHCSNIVKNYNILMKKYNK